MLCLASNLLRKAIGKCSKLFCSTLLFKSLLGSHLRQRFLMKKGQLEGKFLEGTLRFFCCICQKSRLYPLSRFFHRDCEMQIHPQLLSFSTKNPLIKAQIHHQGLCLSTIKHSSDVSRIVFAVAFCYHRPRTSLCSFQPGCACPSHELLGRARSEILEGFLILQTQSN